MKYTSNTLPLVSHCLRVMMSFFTECTYIFYVHFTYIFRIMTPYSKTIIKVVQTIGSVHLRRLPEHMISILHWERMGP